MRNARKNLLMSSSKLENVFPLAVLIGYILDNVSIIEDIPHDDRQGKNIF